MPASFYNLHIFINFIRQGTNIIQLVYTIFKWKASYFGSAMSEQLTPSNPKLGAAKAATAKVLVLFGACAHIGLTVPVGIKMSITIKIYL